MLSLLLLFTAQEDLNQTIVYGTRAKDVGRVLAEIQTKTGVPFEARGLKNTPVIVSVGEMPLRRLMDKLAEVTDSTWQQEQQKFVLVRTDARIKAAAADEARLRGARFAEWARIAGWKPQHKWTDPEIAKQQAEARKRITEHARALVDEGSTTPYAWFPNVPTPALGLLKELLITLDPSVIGGLQAGPALMFSNGNAPGMMKLPVKVDSLLETYRANRGNQAKSAWKEPFEIGPTSVTTNQSFLLKPFPPDPVLTLTLKRTFEGQFFAELVLQSKEDVLDYARTPFGFTPERGGGLDIPKDAKLTLSNLAKKIQARSKLTFGTQFLVRVGKEDEQATHYEKLLPLPDSELMAALQTPVDIDPLSTLPTDWVFGIAKSMDRDVIAYLPDSLSQGLWDLEDGSSLSEGWPTMIASGVQAQVEPGLLTLKPSAFARADRYRFDRNALQSVLRKFGPHSRPAIADLLSYARTCPIYYFAYRPDILWTKALDPHGQAFGSFAWEYGHRVIKLAAELPLPEAGSKRQTFAQDLSPSARLRYRELASSFEYLDGRQLAWDVPSFRQSPSEFPSVLRQPRPEGIITAYRVGDGILGGTTSGISLAMTPFELGFRMGLDPKNLPEIDATGGFDSLQVFLREELELSFMVNAANSFPQSIVGGKDFGPVGPYDQLPNDIKAVADRIAARAKTIKLKVDRGQSNTGAPPPRP